MSDSCYASQVGAVRRLLNEFDAGLRGPNRTMARIREIVGKGADRGITRPDGLTDEEGIAADAIATAAQSFCELPVQHPNEAREFTDALHRAQNILAVRIARRCYSHGWPTHAP